MLVVSVMLVAPVLLVVSTFVVSAVPIAAVVVGGAIGSVLRVSRHETDLIAENKNFGKSAVTPEPTITKNTNTIGSQRESVRLRSTSDGTPISRVEKQVEIVRRVLSLNKIIELAVFGSLLAVDGIQMRGWVGAEVQGGVLLGLTVLYGRSDHLDPSGRVELMRSVCGVAFRPLRRV